MINYIVQIDDDEGGKDRKIYLTSWGTSVWKDYALKLGKQEADKRLSDYIKTHKGVIGRVLKNGS